MKEWKKFSHLSYRAVVLLIAMGVAVFLPWPISIAYVCFIFLICWLWLIRPYILIERMLGMFLEGYSLSPLEAAKIKSLSPMAKRMFEQFNEILSPSQLYDMNKRQAQYLTLQNQINPHFLYNTLESIRSEAILAGLDSVADMTESLATFFRYTISKVENLVSLEEELQNCETYFHIQKYRFGDRLNLSVQCAPEDVDDIFRCRIPKLTMQPILENSIIHGTELKIGTGHLIIHLSRSEKRLLIRVSDDGLGMDEEVLKSINEKLGKSSFSIANTDQEVKGGYALVNVNNRIRLLFGDEYGLHIFSVPGVGTDVEISLPAISSDRELKESDIVL